jgi:hypothetical protein
MFKLEKHPDCRLLSFQEERSLSWLVANPGMAANLSISLLTHQKVDIDSLTQTLQSLCVRHDALRTTFHVLSDGSFERRVASAPAEVPITVVDQPTAESDDIEVNERVMKFIDTPFTETDPCLLRVLVVNIRGDRSVLILCLAHLITDGSANDVLIEEFWDEYTRRTSRTPLKKPPLPEFTLCDYVGSQREWSNTDDFRSKLETTSKQVAAQALSLLAQESKEFAGAELSAQPAAAVPYSFDNAAKRAMESLAEASQATPFVVMFTLSAAALSVIHGRRSFFMVFTFGNRLIAGTQRMVGFLSNQVPVFCDVDPDVSFRQLVRDTNRRSFGMMLHGGVPYSELSRVVLGSNKSIRNVLNRYLFTMTPPTSSKFVGAGGLTAEGYPISRRGFIGNDLQLVVREVDGVVTLRMRVPTAVKDLAERQYIAQLDATAKTLLANPDKPLGRLLGRAAG